MKKKLFIKLAILFLIISGMVFISGAEKGLNDYKDNVYRLHVIANSDIEEDQEIKLAVRDAVLEAAGNELSKTTSKAEAKEYIEENLKRIENEAKKVLSSYEADYSLELKSGVSDFPDKYYGDMFYPEGEYESLKIVLGKGEGENWWCVMFPPLCIVGFEKDEDEKKKEEEEDVEYKSFFAEKYKEYKKGSQK